MAQCLKCEKELLKTKELFFFVKSEKDVHLAIKPEIVASVGSHVYEERESKKKVCVKCQNCNGSVGRVVPFGKDGTNLWALGKEKIVLCGRKIFKEKLGVAMLNFPDIDRRDLDNFYGELSPNAMDVVLDTGINTNKHEKVVFPDPDDISLFEWFTVTEKTPRRYQINAFVEALQRNLVVALKTGAGKTLIASMLIARICSMNPKKMGLMIVDRIPLVFQQGMAIADDTDLNVVSLCGENKTDYKLEKIRNREYDVLVVTAGAFNEILRRKQLQAEMFCVAVFDECHHLNGEHVYVEVIRHFTTLPYNFQPRILGLSASPISGRTIKQAQNKLEKFLQNFPLINISCPNIKSYDNTQVKTEEMKTTNNQKRLIQTLVNLLNSLLKEIYQSVNINSGLYMKDDLLNSSMLVGDLRAISVEYFSEDLDRSMRQASLYIEAIDVCNFLGVRQAKLLLNEEAPELQVFERFVDEDSTRLRRVTEILDNVQQNSKILVFANTRSSAKIVHSVLAERYERLNPLLIVGHGGADGMDWEFEQEDVISMFRSGECNLIVSTSVLEEGIDVSECDVVISFSGVNNVIQFVQMRGRARKQNSVFYVFEEECERLQKKDLATQEEMLRLVLNGHHCSTRNTLFASRTQEIVRMIEENVFSGGTSDDLTTLTSGKTDRKKEISFTVYIENIQDQVNSAVKMSLIESLQEFTGFKVKRLENIGNMKAKTPLVTRVFSENSRKFLVGANSLSHERSPLDIYYRFCREYSFSITKGEFETWNVWTEFNNTNFSQSSGQVQLTPARIEFGYMVDRSKCVVLRNFAENDEMLNSLIFCENNISILYFDGLNDDEMKEIIPFTSFGDFCILTHEAEFSVLSIPLKFGFREPLIQFTFNKTDLHKLIHAVSSKLPVPTFNTKLERIEPLIHNDLSGQLSPSINWAIKVAEDSRMFCHLGNPQEYLFNNFLIDVPDMVEQMKLIEIAMKMYSSSCQQYPYFTSFSEIFSEMFNKLKEISQAHLGMFADIVPPSYVMVRRVVITTERCICLSAVPVCSNRFLRLFADQNLIIVLFRKETMARIKAGAYTEPYLHDGFTLNGLHYHYLASSGSQLRECKFYFVQLNNFEEVLRLRARIIPDTTRFDSAAKYLSRLGMYGTSDNNITFTITPDMYTLVEDEKASNGDLTTDGAGKISLSLAGQISSKMEIDVPSAFQIRFSGTKGILVCVEDSDAELNGTQIAFRKSMKKFENSDQQLCITSYSRYNSFTLNREVITLMSAISERNDVYRLSLLQLQEDALKNAADIFVNEQSARNALKEELSHNLNKPLDNLKFIDDPFWFSVLQGLYQLKVKGLSRKTHIPLENACLLMGVPDPYGILKEGEIFVQYIQDNENGPRKVLTGDVMVLRNPCLHPGDMRTVVAVDLEVLRSTMINVVVFASKGCQTSLPMSCSGGDLDGDQYAVIWDERLVAGHEHNHPPCDYAGIANAQPDETLADEDASDPAVLANFVLKFIENECLGRIAYKHLAYCDQVEKGARNQISVALATSQSVAVDFPKTGRRPKVPIEVSGKLKYPDFMETSTKKDSYYNSENILGFLYRHCRSVGFDSELVSGKVVETMQFPRFMYERWEVYKEDAIDVYLCYHHHMQQIIMHFGLRVEADVILANATYYWCSSILHNKGNASKAIAQCFTAVITKYRTIFNSNVHTIEERMAKAAAWYRLVNDPKIRLPRVQDKMLSFPWIVGDVLLEIAKERPHQSLTNTRIGNSVLEYFKHSATMLLKNISDKENVAKKIYKAIERYTGKLYELEKNAFDVSLYGSTSMFVCELESDIDVVVVPKPKVYKSKILPVEMQEKLAELPQKDIDKHILEMAVSPALNSITASKRDVFQTKVPVIKCEIGNDDEHTIKCDVSVNLIGRSKTRYVHFLYQENSNYFLIFWSLVKWARYSGLVKSFDADQNAVMDTADFYAVIVSLLECPEYIQPRNRYISINKLYGMLDRQSKNKSMHKLGESIFRFYSKLSTLKGTITFSWPIPDVPNVTLDEKQIELAANAAQATLNCLTATRNMGMVFDFVLKSMGTKAKSYSVKLPRSISHAIDPNVLYHSTRLTQSTGAMVRISEIPGTSSLLLEAEGTNHSICLIRQEIQHLMHTNKALLMGRLPQATSRYFMMGSSVVLIEGKLESQDPKLFYTESHGPSELLHNPNRKDYLYVDEEDTNTPQQQQDSNATNDSPIADWEADEYKRFRSKVVMQMALMPEEELKDSFDLTVRFGCFNLLDINSRLQDHQSFLLLSNFQHFLDKGKAVRKQWKRGEFQDHHKGEPQEKKIKMVELRKGGLRHQVEKVNWIKRKLKKKGITSAFTPGLLKQNNNMPETRENLLRIYKTVLQACNFTEGTSFARRTATWKISLQPSTSFEVDIQLDDKFNVSFIGERALNWVQATLITRNKRSYPGNIQSEADLRIQIASQTPIKEDSELYNSVYPMVKGKRMLPIKLKSDGTPTLSSPNSRRTVSLVRHTPYAKHFTDGTVNASITMGTCYSGDQFQVTRPVCELTLYFNPAKARVALSQKFLNAESVEAFTHDIFYKSLQVKGMIKQVIAQSDFLL